MRRCRHQSDDAQRDDALGDHEDEQSSHAPSPSARKVISKTRHPYLGENRRSQRCHVGLASFIFLHHVSLPVHRGRSLVLGEHRHQGTVLRAVMLSHLDFHHS